MSLWVYNEDSIGTGTRITAVADREMFIAANVVIRSTNDTAIRGEDGGVGVHVSAGAQVIGTGGGIRLADSSGGTGRWVEVDQGARIAGNVFGVAIYGDDSVLTNRGQISSTSYGVLYNMSDANHSTRIVNSGQIVGQYGGVTYNSADALGVVDIVNTGLIWGGNSALTGASETVFRITNRGQMRGDVDTGNKADLVDTLGGKITGQINLLQGNDTLRPGANVETANGGDGIDLLDFSAAGAVKVSLSAPASNTGSAAGDTYTGFENILGSVAGHDQLQGDAFANLLDGQGGDDTLQGLAGNDTLLGGAGDDLLDGGVGVDRMEGGAGNDRYLVDSTSDVVFEVAGGGTDLILTWVNLTLTANVESATVVSSSGRALTGNTLANVLTGANGNDTLNGGAGRDTLNGDAGNDLLNGGVDRDLLSGGAGNDRLIGGAGRDTLIGGAGSDRFVFTARSDKGDVINDFTRGSDKIEISRLAFDTSLATGTLASKHFVSRTDNKAQDSNDRFIFRTTDDTLWFDSNGKKAGGLILLADFATDLPLTASDILIV